MREAGWDVSGHVVSILGVSAGCAACHSDAVLGSRARQVRGGLRSMSGRSSGVSVAE